MLLNYLNWITKRFWVKNNVCTISSLYSKTLDGVGEVRFDEIVDSITTTSDSVVAPCETGVWGFLSSNSILKLIQGYSWGIFGILETG